MNWTGFYGETNLLFTKFHILNNHNSIHIYRHIKFSDREIVYIGSPCNNDLRHMHMHKAFFYYFLASDDFCRRLITFANSLDPDQDRHYVGPDLDPNRLTF